MMRKLPQYIGVGLLTYSLSFSSSSFAYKEPTHVVMSEKAANTSVLSQRGKLNDLGFLYSIDDPKQKFKNATGEDKEKKIIELIQDGADFEDSGFRALSHFFNPVTNKPLEMAGISLANTSPDWALEDNGDILVNLAFPQTFSYKDARQYFYEALTTIDNIERNKKMGLTFQTLGQVIHHVQDMAQPQHVRNDAHLDQGNWEIFGLQLNPLYNPSLYEIYTNQLGTGIFNGTAYPDLDFETFKSPRTFWTNAQNKGLAQFTNSNFVSAGTNFDRPDATQYPLPAFNPVRIQFKTATDLCTELGTNCPQVFKDNPSAQVAFYGTDVVDQYHPETNTANPRASTKSIFDDALTKAGKSAVFSLNRFNFDAAHGFLIPRAVGYSAGLINYFFRGKMEISLPNEGVYGIIDHNDPASNAKDTGGFTKIKLKIKNITPKGADIEPMTTGGKLLAVVKFHRNNCYAADLSGEYGSPGVDWNTCRGEDEEIVVSSTAVDAPATINSEPTQVEFSFAKPKQIPINATDLFLQVVYRGPLGDEQDAVVVATKDISEPTYVYNYIRWDQYTYKYSYPDLESPTVPGTGISWATWCLGGYPSVEACNQIMGVTVKMQYSPSADPIPGYDPAGAERWYNMDEVPEPPLSPIATLVTPVGNLARIAVLLDAVPSNTALRVSEQNDLTYQTGVFSWITGTAQAATNQRDPQTGNLIPSVRYLFGRDVYLPDIEDGYLNDGDAYPMPPLVLTPSQISPNW